MPDLQPSRSPRRLGTRDLWNAPTRPSLLEVVGMLVFLVVRGVLLWAIVPLSALVWLVALQAFEKPRVTIGAFVGWVDNNVAFILQRSLFRFAFNRRGADWIPASERSRVKHRVGITDAF